MSRPFTPAEVSLIRVCLEIDGGSLEVRGRHLAQKPSCFAVDGYPYDTFEAALRSIEVEA